MKSTSTLTLITVLITVITVLIKVDESTFRKGECLIRATKNPMEIKR